MASQIVDSPLKNKAAHDDESFVIDESAEAEKLIVRHVILLMCDFMLMVPNRGINQPETTVLPVVTQPDHRKVYARWCGKLT